MHSLSCTFFLFISLVLTTQFFFPKKICVGNGYVDDMLKSWKKNWLTPTETSGIFDRDLNLLPVFNSNLLIAPASSKSSKIPSPATMLQG